MATFIQHLILLLPYFSKLCLLCIILLFPFLGGFQQKKLMYHYDLRSPRGSYWVQISSYVLFIFPIPILCGNITRLPMTLDELTSMFLAKSNRYNNDSRKERAFKASGIRKDEEVSLGHTATQENTAALAAVVGYREEPGLFAGALNGYKSCPSLGFLLVGVDGDDAEDMEMIQVFKEMRSYEDVVRVHKRPS